jgi:GT2 family glycosyltransferase
VADTLTAFVSAYRKHGDALYGGVALVGDSHEPRVNMSHWHFYPGKQRIYYRYLQNIPFKQCFPSTEPIITASVVGFSMLIPISVVRQYGFMDPTFFLYAEDGDYAFRLRRQGVRCYLVPEAITFHTMSGSYRDQSRLTPAIRYYQVRNRLILRRRHFSRRVYAQAILREYLVLIKRAAQDLAQGEPVISNARHTLLAIHDARAGRMGKTFAPEGYL